MNTGGSIFLGEGAGANDDLSDNNNIFIGHNSGYYTSTGGNNVSMGAYSFFNNTTGYNNTAIGRSAMNANTTGNWNTVLGSFSLFSNSTGEYNTAVGYYALYYNESGSSNTAIGRNAGRDNQGSGNVFIGYKAGEDENGSNKLFISNSDTPDPLIWGDFESEYVNINGRLGVGDSSPDAELDVDGSIHYSGSIIEISDRRLKENFKSIENVMDKIHQITGLSYNMKDDSLKVREYGVIAQDVQKVFPEMVKVMGEEEGYLGVSYVQLIPVLLEAIKEQQREIETLKTQTDELAEMKIRMAKIEALLQRDKVSIVQDND